MNYPTCKSCGAMLFEKYTQPNKWICIDRKCKQYCEPKKHFMHRSQNDVCCPYCQGPVFLVSGLMARFICLNRKCIADEFHVTFKAISDFEEKGIER